MSGPSATTTEPRNPQWPSVEAPAPRAARGPPPRADGHQFTFTADQAAATALYWVLPVPYRSLAAFRVAVRAAL